MTGWAEQGKVKVKVKEEAKGKRVCILLPPSPSLSLSLFPIIPSDCGQRTRLSGSGLSPSAQAAWPSRDQSGTGLTVSDPRRVLYCRCAGRPGDRRGELAGFHPLSVGGQGLSTVALSPPTSVRLIPLQATAPKAHPPGRYRLGGPSAATPFPGPDRGDSRPGWLANHILTSRAPQHTSRRLARSPRPHGQRRTGQAPPAHKYTTLIGDYDMSSAHCQARSLPMPGPRSWARRVRGLRAAVPSAPRPARLRGASAGGAAPDAGRASAALGGRFDEHGSRLWSRDPSVQGRGGAGATAGLP